MGGALQSPGGTGAAPKGTLARSPAALEERRQDGDLVVGVPAEPAGETDRGRSWGGAAPAPSPASPTLPPPALAARPMDPAPRARRARGRCPSRPSPPQVTQASSREGKNSAHSSLYPPARGWRLTGGEGRSAASGERGGRGGEGRRPPPQQRRAKAGLPCWRSR